MSTNNENDPREKISDWKDKAKEGVKSSAQLIKRGFKKDSDLTDDMQSEAKDQMVDYMQSKAEDRIHSKADAAQDQLENKVHSKAEELRDNVQESLLKAREKLKKFKEAGESFQSKIGDDDRSIKGVDQIKSYSNVKSSTQIKGYEDVKKPSAVKTIPSK
ncbi:hypothetical protein [Thalassobacillus hwangdonensis]|uniref:Gas vesicle protein GvpQ n=1 Tax=Thalassobacillus hwangdonensis TaxID=546108 RepID=A0ABW3L661_9BACI